MTIPISAKIPWSYGPPALQKGTIGGFLGVGPDRCGSFSCAVLYRLDMNYSVALIYGRNEAESDR
ncbi:MAG TPA: hypothetical protein VH851_11260 [Candidatus Binatia bacterium]